MNINSSMKYKFNTVEKQINGVKGIGLQLLAVAGYISFNVRNNIQKTRNNTFFNEENILYRLSNII